MRSSFGSWAWCGAAGVAAWLAAACAVEVQNTQPARELARQARAPGSVYSGWRVFQDKCASCHGPDAAGSASAPNLTERVATMGPRRFVGLVLQRYDWNLPAGQAATTGAARDALIGDIVERRYGAVEMPAWAGEPQVSAHIMDLYAYLAARAQGTQGPGRPAP